MTTEIKVPSLPESVADATVVTWHKKVGDNVKRDENLVDLETDKVVLEVPAPEDGVIEKIIKNIGSVVKANEILATIKAGKTAETKATSTKEASKETIKQASVPSDMGPSARRTVAEKEIDVDHLKGSGKGGRITKEDVLSQPREKFIPSEMMGDRIEKRVPMSRLRARIAERLLAAQHNAAILTTFNEVNLKNVMELRARYKDSFEKKHGIKLGFMSFFARAVVEALKHFPDVNASIDGNDIVYHGYYDIGIAVSTDRGLVVPVIRNVDRMSFANIEQQIAEYGRKARDGAITIDDMTGGTFTITNGGVFGSLLATPIINPPQSAILGMHKIEERPIAENGQIVIRPMMYVALSYDHRIIDGKESVGFLVAIKEFLEDPARMLLNI